MKEIPIVIPAYEPDERLILLLHSLKESHFSSVIIVDDGSGRGYQRIFDRAKEILGSAGTIISYPVNQGKGNALKTAFRYVLEHYPDAVGCVTADSDGQHTAKDICDVKDSLLEHPGELVMGVRVFSKEDIPWKSWFGNTLTIKLFRLTTGIHVSDTQTGLRGIPLECMRDCLAIKQNRFEFEMQMLFNSAGKYPVHEVPIETIYESKEDHQTHFDPIRDSVRIYKLLLGRFFKYTLSSFSASIIDLVMFQIFCLLFKYSVAEYIAISTLLARIISATYNYGMNYRVVFRSNEHAGKAALKYLTLAILQMSLSALLVTGGVKIIPVIPEVMIKIPVDTGLFFASYYIQKQLVFQKTGK